MMIGKNLMVDLLLCSLVLVILQFHAIGKQIIIVNIWQVLKFFCVVDSIVASKLLMY
jgi:hypothetical protein